MPGKARSVHFFLFPWLFGYFFLSLCFYSPRCLPHRELHRYIANTMMFYYYTPLLVSSSVLVLVPIVRLLNRINMVFMVLCITILAAVLGCGLMKHRHCPHSRFMQVLIISVITFNDPCFSLYPT